jgi:hypothetical protein
MGQDKLGDKPIFEVTATPIKGTPTKKTFTLNEPSVIIAGSTVPYVSKESTEASIEIASKALDSLISLAT